MDPSSSEQLEQHWREERPVKAPARTEESSTRGMTIFLVLAVMLGLMGFIAGIFSWLVPIPSPHFLGVWVVRQQARALPDVPMAQRDFDSVQAGSYFTRLIGDSLARQAGHELIKDLLNLKNLRGNEGLVVYLCAHALRDVKGNVAILPSDASPDNPASWVALRKILELLRDCPAPMKLLVLDIANPLGSARLGTLFQDVASGIPEELADVPDGKRLVLCSCSPGQVSLVSEELGRSIFSHYFEEGLKGYASAGYSRRPDAHVDVQELANFVRARVDRWALRNRGVRQTPVLYGSGPAFSLLALAHGERRPHQPEVLELQYPSSLEAGWKARDAWWQQGTFRLAPRAFMQAQAFLLASERYWRDGVSLRIVAEDFVTCQAELERSVNLVKPATISLAQQAAQGARPADNLTKLLQDWFVQYHRQVALAKPEEVAPLRTKLLGEVRDKTKEFSGFPLEQAVFQLAVQDGKNDPSNLRLLDQIMHRPGQPLPAAVEIHVLAQLAELASQLDNQTWPAELVGRVLDVIQKGEQAASDPRAFAWIRSWLDEASLPRHEAEVRLWARGFASLEDADRLIKRAGRNYDVALQHAAKLTESQNILAEALAVLPDYPPFLESHTVLQKPWEQAVHVARELAEQLRAAPGREEQATAKHIMQLGSRLADAHNNVVSLRDLLRELNKPFTPQAVQKLIKQSRQAQADGEVYTSMRALLRVPHPAMTSEDRIALWKACHALGKRLMEETLQLDRDDNARGQTTAAPDSLDDELVRLHEQGHARDRGRVVLAMFELGGITPAALQPLRDAIDRASREPSPQNWSEAGALVRQWWLLRLPAVYKKEEVLARREQLTWIFPGLDHFRFLDEADVSATTQVRLNQARDLGTWLAEFFRYRARDYQGLGLDSPALAATHHFFTRAVLANQDVRLNRECYLSMHATGTVADLTPERSVTSFNLTVNRFLPEYFPGDVEVRLVPPNRNWLQVNPETTTIAAVADAGTAPRTLTTSLPIQVALRPGAAKSLLERPDGILVEARLGNRVFHRVVPIPLHGLTPELQLLLSANPSEPEPPLQEIRLRPGKIRQSFHLFVKNLTGKSRKLLVEVVGADGLLAASTVVVGPQATQPVRLDDKGPPAVPTKDADKAPLALPELQGPLEIRLRDADQPGAVLATTKVRVAISSPREYVGVTDIRFDPATPRNEGKNKLAVMLVALAPVPGPPITADLVFPARRIPGFLGIAGGTFHGEVPNKGKLTPITLFGEKIALTPGSDDEGPVYVTVDGVERSFIFRASLGKGVEPSVPRGDGRPAVRLVVEPFAQAGANFLVPVEADNAPNGASVEVSLGRQVQGVFETDAVRRFPTAKNQEIGCGVQKGSLVFEAGIRDWQARFDTTSILGQRILRARLLDEAGNEIQQHHQSILFDNNAPALIRFIDPPAKVKRGTVLAVQAQGRASASGVAQATFFLGKPQEGRIPPNSATIPGTPVDPGQTTWSAKIPLPADGKGPTPITVQFVNKVGLSTFETTTIELTETEPGVTGLGKIQGRVTEGPRNQGGLVVILRDEKGKELARTKGKDDGAFTFENLKPGRFVLFVQKPDSQRRATMNVVVEANKTTTVTLNLSL